MIDDILPVTWGQSSSNLGHAMHKLSDCVDYADSRLDDLILEALGEGLWVIFRHSEIDPAAPHRGVAHMVVTDEILDVLGLCPAALRFGLGRLRAPLGDVCRPGLLPGPATTILSPRLRALEGLFAAGAAFTSAEHMVIVQSGKIPDSVGGEKPANLKGICWGKQCSRSGP